MVSLDRPYDLTGAYLFLAHERNLIQLAERIGVPLAYETSMDLATDPGLLAGASALISCGHDEYWTPQERANVTAARNAGVNVAFLGANAMFMPPSLAVVTDRRSCGVQYSSWPGEISALAPRRAPGSVAMSTLLR